MLKTAHSVNMPGSFAVDSARALLCNVPDIQIESVECGQHTGLAHGMDGLIALAHRGGNYALVIAVRPDGAPRHVRAGVYQLRSCVEQLRRSDKPDGGRRFVPMIISSYLSPASRAICLDHDIAYLDLLGNARLVFDSVYIERAVAEKPVSETRSLRSVFSPKAAAVLRVLLREPGRAWRVADLAAQARASHGHVSNVRKALLAREWAEAGEDGIVLVRPDALLQTWRESYRPPAGELVTGYTHLHGKQLDEQLPGTLNRRPGRPRALCARHSAAHWLAPFGRNAGQSFYADREGAEALKEALKLTHPARGENVALLLPADESLFHDAIEPAPGVFCTHPIVTYLDLQAGNDRDREAAEHLAGKYFPWLG